MELTNRRLSREAFAAERDGVLSAWPTGREINFADGVRYQTRLPDSKRFSAALAAADANAKTLIQPRAGVALLEEHIALLKSLEDVCDVLPTTIDAYTRLNRYDEAATGIARSKAAGVSLLNGFPAVNHGLGACRTLVESLTKPVQVRHGTPDARLLAEITMAAGFTAFEGGGISYNVPYSKRVPLERSIRHWQYCDRLIGMYEEEGVRINREPFGPLSGTLVPPFVSHCVALIEGLLALEQGAKCITLGYGQAGNLAQDVAAIRSLRELGDEFFRAAGFEGYQLSTVFHQWMGGFPDNESMAFSVICWGAATAAMAGATKVIVKTPQEAAGVPTAAANRQGLEATTQTLNMVRGQNVAAGAQVEMEVELIKREVRAVMRKVFELGRGDVAVGAVRAFEAGVMDIPFAPAACNAGRLMPIRDNEGAVRIFDAGHTPLPDDVIQFHKDKIAERARAEQRPGSFHMVVDDISAISRGHLVGRPA
ncbi:MAG TPA: methylaspartate mutase subunit E [Ramlibacter sp.]|uniref:methylaspartate mutase subunit E n=1 Tax=Ramlibacter sp. TaxID=1917967 RepID=UPI002C5231CF|nr:methylaspartate mutase subunit E [Ramlibacter sp.]HVZ44829.1 methylaspartate mutase subunit E [Ramlibacter sp.]